MDVPYKQTKIAGHEAMRKVLRTIDMKNINVLCKQWSDFEVGNYD
jgi:hypothetical protein